MSNNKKLVLSLLIISGILLVFFGSSYSLFNLSKYGKIENKLVTGTYETCEYKDGTTWTFDYIGSEQTFTIPCDGEYKLETWGAQGGVYSNYTPGYGGYSNGVINLEQSEAIYITVGGKGVSTTGGYNGGGSSSYNAGGGGGATHIATTSGLLKGLENSKDSILIVSGGGGGTGSFGSFSGGSAGGYIGKNGGGTSPGQGGTQTSGGTPSSYTGPTATSGGKGLFGSGGNGGSESAYSNASGAGGAGFYGGSGGGARDGGGGGGSSYIGNSLLTDKMMYCYNCTESSEESTKTVSTTCTSETPTENCSKQGNGYAKITLVKAKYPAKEYTELILNGTDPVLKDNLVPVTIASDGTVKKADIYTEWYNYENKEWANAVILKDETTTYNDNEVIPETAIESYFVWIPRYKYQIFDEGNYTGLTTIENKVQTINVVFENKDTTASNGTTKDSWLTHPAFTSFDSNGFWVGKFETGYDGATSTTAAEVNSVNINKIVIKPNTYSWRSMSVGNMFKNSYDYQRSLDSHMMKNTEWGAVAYLQHSAYGSQSSVRINNNSAFITGYAGTEEPTKGYNSGTSIAGNRVESTSIGVDGTYTVNYLNANSGVASTTGNKTGIYDMSGGAWEYVAGYTTGASTIGGSSEIISLYPSFFTDNTYTKYWDKYTSTTNTNYNYRLLGDATGEMGPFGSEKDPDNNNRYKSSWYGNYAHFVNSSYPWLLRGGHCTYGSGSGAFAFDSNPGGAYSYDSFRIVLTPIS